METTLKNFLQFHINKINKEEYAAEYEAGERYVANYQSDIDGTFFSSKKEASDMWRERKDIKGE